MMYALVRNNAVALDRLPRNGVWNDGSRDWDLRPMSDAQLAALGWLSIVLVARPADTATHTSDYGGLVVDDGLPTQTWNVRPKTQAELDAATAAANEAALRFDPQARIDTSRDVVTALSAIRNRTNAEINNNPAAALKDVVAAIMPLPRTDIRLLRLVNGPLDSTDGVA